MIHPSPPRSCLSPQYPEVAKDKRSKYHCSKEYRYLRHNSCQKCDHHFSPRQLLHCPTTPVVPPSAAQSNWSQEGNRAVPARTSGSMSAPHSDKVCQEPILKHILPELLWSSQRHWHLLGTLTRWPGWHWPLTRMPSLRKPHGFKAVFMPQSHQGRNTDNISDAKASQEE